jgi:hypothetical protein
VAEPLVLSSPGGAAWLLAAKVNSAAAVNKNMERMNFLSKVVCANMGLPIA